MWIIHIYKSSCKLDSGAGVVLEGQEEEVLKHVVQLAFHASKNKSQYVAMAVGLKLALCMGTNRVILYSNSQLVINQINSEYEAKEEQLIKLFSLRQKTNNEWFQYDQRRSNHL